MLSIKRTLLFILSLILLSSCKEGVKGGSVKKDFSGIDTITVLSPTAVQIDWTANENYSEYQVFGDYQTDPLTTGVFESAVIDGLTPGNTYTFKVVGINGTQKVGAHRELSVTMPQHFTGLSLLTTDIDNNVVLKWSYSDPVLEYWIFLKAEEDPTAANTNNWATPDYTTTQQEITIPLTDLKPSTTYHFIVHAKYREGEFHYTTPIKTYKTPSIVPELVDYSLVPISIGPTPFANITTTSDPNYPSTNYTSQLFVNNSPVSNPLKGSGTLYFSGNLGLSRGFVENISIQVKYDDGNGLTETQTITTEKGSSNPLKTYIKDQSPILDLPPESISSNGAAFLGEAIAKGDFNCDGYDDLAIGMPQASLAQFGVHNAKAGAIVVYYSYSPDGGITYTLKTSGTPSLNPTKKGEDPQVITFDDLNLGAAFGFSMDGGGNINGDKKGTHECEDLVVGAPFAVGKLNNTRRVGSAFVFFGSPYGLNAPKRMADFQENTSTCDGAIENATCSAVRLWPDETNPGLFLNANGTSFKDTHLSNNEEIQFGAAVSFIGDFNADGYDDIAIGAPNAPFDGQVDPSASPTSDTGYYRNVGYVALYFGSPNGLAPVDPDGLDTGTTYTGTRSHMFLKVFPPIPEENMKFGASIDGGVDVDGNYLVKNGSTFVGGSDMVIGAPGFEYTDPASSPVSNVVASPVFAESGWWFPTGNSGLSPSPYGFSVGGTSATGAAFLYFGRKATGATGTGESWSTFYNCSKRNIAPVSTTDHYSCFTTSSHYRILFPRDSQSTNFGSTVALLGLPSYRDPTTNNPYSPAPSNLNQDPNGDLLGDIVVVASDANNGSNTKAGAIWLFYGNLNQNFESQPFDNADGDNNPANDYNTLSSCNDFSQTNPTTTDLKNCSPTRIISTAVSSNAQMGYFAESIDTGDLNDDGLTDVLIGAPFYSDASNTHQGSVFAFTGNGKGLSPSTVFSDGITGDADDQFGSAVAIGMQEASGTSFPVFVAVGSPYDETQRNGGGGTLLYWASFSGIESAPDTRIDDSLATFQDYGYHLTRVVGDINGDGYDDAVTRMKRRDASGNISYDAVVFFGSPEGLITTEFCLNNLSKVFLPGQENSNDCYPQTTTSRTLGNTQPFITLPQLIPKPTTVHGQWAAFVYGAGDINGDGKDDVLFVNNKEGEALILYFGTSGGLQALVNPRWRPNTNDPQIVTKTLRPRWIDRYLWNCYEGSCYNGRQIVNTPIQHGDFNNDGYEDLVIADPVATAPALPGGWTCTNPAPSGSAATNCTNGTGLDHHGMVYIIYGSKNGLQTPSVKDIAKDGQDYSSSPETDPEMAETYNTENGTNPAACSGNSNTGPLDCKAAFLRNPVFRDFNYGFNRFKHRFGAGLVVMDYNHDGIDDLLVGAPGFENLSCWPNSDGDATYKDYGRIYLFAGAQDKGLIAASKIDYYNSTETALGSCDFNPDNDPSLGT
ncbi:MAG: hypothetical protein D6797_00440, partial [Bdellovibrio sp.]